MIPRAIVRRLGPLLVGLYVVAQIGGVIPLMSCHSAHAAGSLVLSGCKHAGEAPREHHHPGDADDVAHHHALQDLNGVLAQPSVPIENHIVHVGIRRAAPRSLVGAGAVLLERPPKPFLLV